MKKSINRLFSILAVILILLNTHCKKNNSEEINEDTASEVQNAVITEKDISNLNITEFALSDQSETITESWNKFKTLLSHMEDLKTGSFSFFKDDKALLQSFLTDLKVEIPEKLNKPSVLVRISAFETVLYKFDEAANIQNSDKETLLGNIKDILLSFNNLIYQINKEIERDSQKIIKPQ
ncbi:hypothetical protein U0L90_00245 [Flavobacteriaceae sp. LMIT009]